MGPMEWIVLLGVVTGMRSMTGIAVLCWGAYLSYLPQHGWAHWTAYLFSAIVFTLFALGEYVGDTLPNTPSRKAPGPAAARLVFGALVGALVASAMSEPIVGGALFGVAGAVIGTWGGWWVRMRLARAAGRDLPIALAESALALTLAIVALWRLHHALTLELLHTA